MNYLYLKRVREDEDLKKFSRAELLLRNNAWRLRGKSYISFYPYYKKSNFVMRLYFYAICDLINDRNVPYKDSVKQKISENIVEYLTRVIYRMFTDTKFQSLPSQERDRQINLLKNYGEIYESDYQTAFRKLENRIIFTKIKRTSNNKLIHKIYLTTEGKILKKYVDEKHIF